MANLVFNEAALHHLLQDPQGAVGRRLIPVSEQIAGNYEAVFNIIWQNQEATLKPRADYVISVGDLGLQSEIGIPPDTHVSEYMAEKFETEADWITPALMTNWDAYV